MTSPLLPPSPSLPPYAPPPAPQITGTVALGVLLALMAAAGIGLAMVTQRYGLSQTSGSLPVLCCRLSPSMTWFIGLVIYGLANGLQAMSLTFGPLFLLGGIFTLLLVFNLLFARLILKEPVTPNKVSGAVIVIIGVTIAIVAAPAEAQTKFSGDEIEALVRGPKGLFWLLVLFSSLFASIYAMWWYEKEYPSATHAGAYFCTSFCAATPAL